jgi:hypothetical protein
MLNYGAKRLNPMQTEKRSCFRNVSVKQTGTGTEPTAPGTWDKAGTYPGESTLYDFRKKYL